MNPSFRRWVGTICFSGVFMLAWTGTCRSEVVVFDRVTTVQTDIRLIVLTKGLLFAEGGQLVDIYLDGRHLKKILTGGDGFGYLKYTPQDSGLKEISASSEAGSATGLLLVMGKNEKAIMIDIESAFQKALFSKEIRENSRRAVNALSKNYKIIYLSRFVGKGIGRTWFKEENFPESVILRWQGPEVLTALEERGVQLQAVIGSEDVLSAAEAQHIEDRYTFEETKAGKTVKNWDEILELLQSAPPAEKRSCEGEKIRR
jgi:hypothetical protein